MDRRSIGTILDGTGIQCIARPSDARPRFESVGIDQPKRTFDLTQGQFLTWNWGVSQYLPLKKDQSLLAEVGPAGYGNFQVSGDTGTDARSPGVHENVYAAGIQVGLTIPKRMMVLNFHWFHEFSAVDRFQGTALGLSFVARLGSPR